jgi:hypothetical protein
LRERAIPKPRAKIKMVVLMDSEDEDEDNLYFLQELRVLKTSTSQPIAKFALLIVPSF